MFEFGYTQQNYVYTLELGKTDKCPAYQYNCLTIKDDGSIIRKCRYAQVTNDRPMIASYTMSGKIIGMRCNRSNAVDFITSD